MINVKTIDDRTLKDLLLMGEEKFQKGAYAIYVEEAKIRGLDLAFLEFMKPENKETRTLADMFSFKKIMK